MQTSGGWRCEDQLAREVELPDGVGEEDGARRQMWVGKLGQVGQGGEDEGDGVHVPA